MISDTLTAGEREHEEQRDIPWRPLREAREENREIALLTRGAGIIVGWMSMRFMGGRRTFWSWNKDVARTLADGRTVPGIVDAVAFAEIPE